MRSLLRDTSVGLQARERTAEGFISNPKGDAKTSPTQRPLLDQRLQHPALEDLGVRVAVLFVDEGQVRGVGAPGMFIIELPAA